MYYTKAYKGGFADGIARRAHANTFRPYTTSWHNYNVGYTNGRFESIETTTCHKENTKQGE